MHPPPGPGDVARSEAPTASRPEAVRVHLLGGFRVLVGEREIEGSAWRLRKAAALVKLLALAPGHRLHRERAQDLLWPELGKRSASNNLRQCLYAARRTLGTDPADSSRYLLSRDEQILLCPAERLWVDVEEFEEAGAAARRARDPAAYRAALDLYAGDLLPEDLYEGWAEERRAELRRSYLALLAELAGLYEERGELEPAAEALRRVVTHDPTGEEAHVGLMRLYALSGRQGPAIAQYERLREVLSDRLGTQPGAAARVLRDEIAAGKLSPARTGPLPEEPAAADKHNLPAPRTSFVGRERDLVEVKRALAMTRLLTLTGAGGAGKTRLAQEVARDLVGAYPDGVWLVELAPLSEGALVPRAVAGALGVPERPDEPLTDTLVEALRPRNALLVVDNCEHLVRAAASLVDALLDACPRVRVLATSREPLNVVGEMNRPVSPLGVPAERASREPTVAELEGSESVRLFVERARHRNPAFELTPENAGAVAEVCRELDGMPLAVELAAARVRALSVQQIAGRLKGSLELLTGGGRMTPERHRTLRGALDWSQDLLDARERALFRRLSVFAGGWSLDAAEAVGAGDEVGEWEVLDLLSDLVDKSLVVAGAEGEAGMRYGMLELVRQYALDKLQESGEEAALRRRHATYFLALAEEAPEAYKNVRPPGWIRRLAEEHDNLRAALSWSLRGNEAELGLRMAGALQPFWAQRGHYGEGRGWLESALAERGEAPAARVKALSGVGWLALWQGDIDRASAAAEEGLRLNRQADGDSGATVHLLLLLGYANFLRGNYERAIGLFEESLRISRGTGDGWGIAASLLQLGNVAGDQDDDKRAVELYEEGIAMCRESGYAVLLADTLTNLGYELLLRGDHERAAELNEEAVALYRERGYRYGRLEFPTDNLGWAALAGGDHERARALHKESLALCWELGNKWIAVESLEGLACAAEARGETERSARLFGAAEALRETLGVSQVPAERALREPYLTAAGSRRDDAPWQEGRGMVFEEAVEYALAEDRPAAPPAPERSPALTSREGEVAALVARGLTNRQIATELSISEHTVATHVGRILNKLGLSSRSRLATWIAER